MGAQFPPVVFASLQQNRNQIVIPISDHQHPDFAQQSGMTDRTCGRCVPRWPTLPKQSLVELPKHACVESAARLQDLS
jgi:hypothetical protein